MFRRCWRSTAGFAFLALLAFPALAPAQDAPPALAPESSWVHRAALYEVFTQDFSREGTLRGVMQGLDRIQAAGANVVWVMPVQPVGVLNHKGTLGSRYAIRDYMAIDSSYGTAGDFRALVDAAHARGLKVILDWVPDHTAWDHPWIQQHPDWYEHDSLGNPAVPRDPKGKPTDWTDVAQLNYRNAGLRQAMIDAMRTWLTRYDLDGFRVDVAGFIPYDFWREAIPALRAAAPRPILLLAESGELAMHRAGFDLTYGWDGYARLKAVWRGDSASRFLPPELAEADSMPAGGMRMRFTTDHDETAWDDPPVLIFGGPHGARAAFVAMALLPGRPLLYNGQEVESPQKLGIFEKEPVYWSMPGADSARAFYAAILRLDRTRPALLGRDLHAVRTSAPADIIAYRRGDLVVLVNPRNRPVRATVSGTAVSGARDLLSGRVQRGTAVALPAWGAVVLQLPARQ